MEAEQRTPLLPQHSHRCLSHCTGSFRLKTSIWSELSGAVGDLGTFIPIVLALTLVNHLDLGTTLIFTGLYNIATGYLFGVPMPVQPMKSIAAVAIAEGPNPLTVAQIAAAGISTAAVLLLLGVTGLMAVFYRLIPLPVVRGIQLAQGLSFAFSAVKYIRFSQNVSTGKSEYPRPFLGLDGLLLALFSLVLGNSFKEIIGEFPTGVLGVLLLFSGIELAMASRDMNSKEESFVMLVCAAVSLTGSSAAIGFGCGLVLFGLLRLREIDWVGLVRRRAWLGNL